MFDYIGYDFGVRSKAGPEDIIRQLPQYQSLKFHKSYDVKGGQQDLSFIESVHIDWGCFRSRFGRIEGFMR
jgi:hypothetical protein